MAGGGWRGPQWSIGRATRPVVVRRSFGGFAARLVRGQLLAQGDVLEGQLTVAAEEEGAEAE